MYRQMYFAVRSGLQAKPFLFGGSQFALKRLVQRVTEDKQEDDETEQHKAR